MEINELLMTTVKKEVNKLHGEIINDLSGTVAKAIKIGDFLNDIKDKIEHGEFLLWIKK